MEKVHLTPGLTEKLERPLRTWATFRQDVSGSRTGFEQDLASCTTGKVHHLPGGHHPVVSLSAVMMPRLAGTTLLLHLP